MISKIENDEFIPTNKLLEQLSSKLEFDLIHYLEIRNQSQSLQKIDEIIKIIEICLSKRDFEMIYLTLKANDEILENNVSRTQSLFFKWIKGLLFYYRENKPEEAIKVFNNLNTIDLPTDLAVDVTCSIGIIHYELNHFERAAKYFEMSLNWFSEKINSRTKIKLLVNYSLCLESMNKNEYALELLFRGIEISKSADSIFGLGDLYYHRGYILKKLNQYSEALRSYKIAHSLFEIQNNEQFVIMTNLRVEELKEIKKNKTKTKDFA